MKKTIILSLCLTLFSMGLSAQNAITADSVDVFLNKFKKFVTEIQVNDSTTAEQFDKYDLTYKNFTKLYSEKYKTAMTNDQLSTYTQYRTRYKVKVLDHKVEKNTGTFAQKADTIGRKMGEGLKKAGSEIEGFVKGLFTKDKKKK